MKDSKPTKEIVSRRSFIKSLAAGGGALCLLGMANSILAKDLEVYSETQKAKDINAPVGLCQCGIGAGCGGSGGGGTCQCGLGAGCSGSG